MSVAAGARAIVCSPLEIAAIRSAVGNDAHIITPGVRPAGSSGTDDQKRTMTPQAALAAGASYVVIGRPITQAWSQGALAMTSAARAIAEDILQ
jgi:orotidine-5'-phosphate decarboxylase